MSSRLSEIMNVLAAQVAGDQPNYCFGQSDEYEVRVASSPADRETAWRLVYETYVEKGYAEPNPQRRWYSIYDALPETVTLLVERQAPDCRPQATDYRLPSTGSSVPIATLTLVFDSPLGLPADGLYRAELDALRSRGRRLCEIVSLASVEDDARRGAEMMKHLFKLAYLAAHHLEDATDLLITVNPRHVSLYRRMLLMEVAGPERAYAKVSGAPAVLLRLDLVAAWDTYKERFGHLSGERNLYRFFLDRAVELREWLRRQRRPLDTAALRRYFVEKRPLLAETPEPLRQYVEDQYLTQINTHQLLAGEIS